MFPSLLNQMAFLFSLIIIGYVLMRFGLVPCNSEAVLSKLENYLFIPALVLGTFISNFTLSKITSAASLIGFSILIEMIVIPISFFAVRFCAKDKYTRNIYLYGLCFSNFGFMGNAIVSSLFEGIFLEYIIFTLVLWCLIYIWGVPSLLISNDASEKSVSARIKNFLNPMLVCAVLGMMIGILNISIPKFATSLISALGDCMSPVAMLITGMTIAKIDLKAVLKIKSIYAVSFLRLVAYPLCFIGICILFKFELSEAFAVCAVASLAMPLGLNTVVIPKAYGLDTKVAAGMALVSHLFSIITIPAVFLMLDKI